jgi:hypothetical protein
MRTRLSKLTIADEVKEAMISHKPSGLHQVYDLHKFADEKRAGFELWAAALQVVLQPPPDGVVPFALTA